MVIGINPVTREAEASLVFKSSRTVMAVIQRNPVSKIHNGWVMVIEEDLEETRKGV